MNKEYPEQRISGVFAKKMVSSIGTGTTARRTEVLAFFFVQEQAGGELELQALGPGNELFGDKRTISREELLENYLPEPQRSHEYAILRASRDQEITKAVARGDKYLKRGENYSAEFEYNKALALDEENVRANFGIGLSYIARSELDKARAVFDRLVKLDAAFENEHKHLFNEFGIRLRMSGMHAEALDYYARAVELCPGDENLHYNMARAAYDMNEAKLAAQHLSDCLRLNPKHEEANRFLAFLKRKKLAGSQPQ